MNRRSIARTPRIALVVSIDLARSWRAIFRDLHARYPHALDLHWELDKDERQGWAFDGVRVLAKLVHVAAEIKEVGKL